MADSEQEKDFDVGYKNPPRSTRFKRGQRANPKGRPRGRHIVAPYEAVLGQMVTISDGGEERQVTAAEAFIMHLTKQGLEGDAAATRVAMTEIEKARMARQERKNQQEHVIVVSYVLPGTVNLAMEPLRMARKLDRYRETARMALEPWIVEAALARFGDKRLTKEEQKIVVRATRTPHKVNWPDWWVIRR